MFSRLRRDRRRDISLGNRTGRRDRLVQHGDNAPALQTADRTGFHDFNLITDLGLVLLVVDMKDGLAIDDLVVTRMGRLVWDDDLDGLVARAAGDDADNGFARAALARSGSGHGEIIFDL